MKKIYLFLFLFICASCTYRPLPDVLWEIRSETYILENCCSHKSAKYASALNDVGIRANVIVGSVRGESHAWVHVINPDNGIIYIDPTGIHMRGIPWCKFREGVTGNEVFIYQGIEEIYLDKIPQKFHIFFKNKLFYNKIKGE